MQLSMYALKKYGNHQIERRFVVVVHTTFKEHVRILVRSKA